MRRWEIINAVNTFFTEGLDEFSSHCEHITGHNGLDENGKLTDRYARILLTDYNIKGLHSKILSGMLYGNEFHDHPNELETLFRCGLIDENHELTSHGHYKAVSTLNFNNQIAYLDLPLDEFGPIKHSGGKHRESYAKDLYSDQYDVVLYDEGKIFDFIKSCFIYASRRYLVDFGFSPTLLKKIYHRPFDFQQAVCQGILKGKWHIFERILSVNVDLLGKDEVQKNVDIVRKSVARSIRYIDINVLFSDAKKMAFGGSVGRHEPALASLEGAFQHLGEEAIRTFIAKLFEHPTPDSRGWSDLSVFHQGQYIPIEVKGSDKLTYPQIERLYWLKNNVPEYAKNQRVSQILLC